MRFTVKPSHIVLFTALCLVGWVISHYAFQWGSLWIGLAPATLPPVRDHHNNQHKTDSVMWLLKKPQSHHRVGKTETLQLIWTNTSKDMSTRKCLQSIAKDPPWRLKRKLTAVFGFISSALFTTCSYLFSALPSQFLISVATKLAFLVIEGTFWPFKHNNPSNITSGLQWTKEDLCHTPLGWSSQTLLYTLKGSRKVVCFAAMP